MAVGSGEEQEEEEGGGRRDEMQHDVPAWTVVAAVGEEGRLEDGEGRTEGGSGEMTLL